MTLALLITAVGGAWAQDTYTVAGNNSDMFGSVWDPTYTANDMTKNGDGTYSITYTNVYLEDNVLYKVVKNHSWDEAYPAADRVITIAEAGTYTLTIHFNPTTHEVYETMPGSGSGEPDVEVTTNAASEGATFTEASFQMPTNDVTVDYELVRDMGYKVAFSGVPTRARLAKDGEGKFHFADPLTFQLLDNIDAANPKDITSAEGITFMVGEVEAVDFEGHTFYQLNKETLVPLADFLADAHLGNYAICAVASTGEYDGSFTSGRITLFQGYEVEVPAKEFITYYKDEPLYVEDTDVTLYTITAVSGDKATATEVTTAPAGLPLLVKNNGTTDKVLLIPATDRTPDTGIEVYAGFKGTLEATTIAASDAATDRYALNGHEFVWVKNPVSIAANKAWLEVPTGAAAGARALTIVFSDETTGVNAIDNGQLTIENWYDLNGRKLNGIPTQKGIYIHNGRKVVVK